MDDREVAGELTVAVVVVDADIVVLLDDAEVTSSGTSNSEAGETSVRTGKGDLPTSCVLHVVNRNVHTL